MSLTGKPDLTENANLLNDGFWPDILVGDFLRNYRAPSEYDNGVIETGLIMAMARVNKALKAGKANIAAPLQPGGTFYADLLEYCTANATDTINDEFVLIHHYRHAVFCTAKAFLLQQFNRMNRKPNAENTANESLGQEEYWLDQAQHSIFDIMQIMAPDEDVSAGYTAHVALI